MEKVGKILEQRDKLILDPKWKRFGYTSLGNKIIINPKISLPAKGLYWYLLTRCFQKNECFPGNELIGKDLGLTRPTIVKYKKELVDNNLIKVKKGGWGKTNRYILRF